MTDTEMMDTMELELALKECEDLARRCTGMDLIEACQVMDVMLDIRRHLTVVLKHRTN